MSEIRAIIGFVKQVNKHFLNIKVLTKYGFWYIYISKQFIKTKLFYNECECIIVQKTMI